MVVKFKQIFILLTFVFISCIDRDSVVGTGKQEPDHIIGTGGSLQTGGVTSLLPVPLTVRVLDEKSKPVRNIHVQFITVKGSASFSDTTAVTDVDGYAKTKVTLGSKAEEIIVNAVLIGVRGSPVEFSLNAIASGADGISIVSGNDQAQTVGQQLSSAILVSVVDKYSNPIYDMNVYFIVPPGKGSITPTVVSTDSTGKASAFWTLDTMAGIQTAEARIPVSQASYVILSATGKADEPARLEKLSPDTIYTLTGRHVLNAIDVRVRDKYSNVVSGANVGFTVTSGEGTMVPASGTTGADGSIASSFYPGLFDTLNTIEASHPNIQQRVFFTARMYKYLQIDSLNSSGGTVTLWWQKNLNSDFISYELHRCDSSQFDNSTITVKTIFEINTVSTTDSSAVPGSSPFYRLKVNCNSSYHFISNFLQVLVEP